MYTVLISIISNPIDHGINYLIVFLASCLPQYFIDSVVVKILNSFVMCYYQSTAVLAYKILAIQFLSKNSLGWNYFVPNWNIQFYVRKYSRTLKFRQTVFLVTEREDKIIGVIRLIVSTPVVGGGGTIYSNGFFLFREFWPIDIFIVEKCAWYLLKARPA